jgi:hypothetical protein
MTCLDVSVAKFSQGGNKQVGQWFRMQQNLGSVIIRILKIGSVAELFGAGEIEVGTAERGRG